ncbi:MAG: type II secretion system GspH family protein, partial [Oscillospiraceae bacterium]|nr:type II secretion system GspH family protein [Oscillospiraceae bacterium]
MIELIVVIAILGILAGAGTVAYTGYVQRAEKSLDQQTVANLIYAVQLADYADSSLFGDSGTGVIAITADKTVAVGTGSSLTDALQDSVGSLDKVKLSYDGWSGTLNSSTLSAMQTTLSNALISANVTAEDTTASYASELSDLWEDVEYYAACYEATNSYGTTSAEYVETAASYTVSNSSNIITAWASGSKVSDLTGNTIGYSTSMARNYAFASYLQNNGYNVSSAVIEELKSINAALFDYFYLAYCDRLETFTTVSFEGSSYSTVLKTAAKDYLALNDSEVNTASQAYVDAATFCGIMQVVVDNTEYETTTDDDGNETTTAVIDDSDAYLNKIASYVSTAGAYLSNVDISSLTDLDDEEMVVITISKSNGVLTFSVSPSELDLWEESSTSSDTSTLTPTLTLGVESLTLGIGKAKSVSCSVENFSGDVSVSCTSENSSVATAEKGNSAYTDVINVNVTGVATGTTTITITVTDGTNTATANLTVKVVETNTPTIALVPSGGSGTSADPYTTCTLTPSGSVVLTTTLEEATVYIQVDGSNLRSTKLTNYSYSGDFVNATSANTGIATVTANNSGSLSVKVQPV